MALADGWVPLGGGHLALAVRRDSAEYTWSQAGWTFSISVPPGHQYQLRAVAELRWSGETNRSETHVDRHLHDRRLGRPALP